MRLSEIHAAIEAGQGPALPEDRSFATLVAIEHLAKIEGVPISALGFSAPEFAIRYPYNLSNLRNRFSGISHYNVWRNLITSGQMQFSPGDVEGNPWKSLILAGRVAGQKKIEVLYDISRYLPEDIRPDQITNRVLIEAHQRAPKKMRHRFRGAVRAFNLLFSVDLALRTGLLPPERPSVKLEHNGDEPHLSISPEIERFCSSIPDRHGKAAVRYVCRVAVAAGRLNGSTDTLDDLRNALSDLPRPTEVNISQVAESTYKSYMYCVKRLIGGPDHNVNNATKAWKTLQVQVASMMGENFSLSGIAKPAIARGICPPELSAEIALDMLNKISCRITRSKYQRSCEDLDNVRGKLPSDLLPPAPIGIRRPPPRIRKPKPVFIPDPVQAAWADLYARLRDRGWTHRQTGALSYIRARATLAGFSPDALDQKFIGTLEQETTKRADRNRLQGAVLRISNLSKEPGFTDLPDLSLIDDRRFSHGGPSERTRTELEDLMDFMNAAASTRRGFRVAVGVLTDAMGRPEISLSELLQADMSAYSLGNHEPRRNIHENKIRNIREFIELPWTPAWQELQSVVTATGVTALDNPVPKVLSWNPGTDPNGLTKEWAQRLDREYRSTLMNPPHGRADIAKTLARHLASFDALHDIPAVAGSGLLPPRIGTIR